MKKLTLKPVLFMIIVTFIYTSVLASINAITIERIQLNEQLSDQISFLYVLDKLPEETDAETINALYEKHINEIEVNDQTIYEGFDQNGELIAYIVPITGNAVWGDLKGLVSLSTDFKEVLGIEFLSHNETPGLGARIDEESFKEQFRGVEIDPDESHQFLTYRPDPDGQVDAISGATGTSNAVRDIFNNNMKQFMSETREALQND
ncbi:Na+-transporting NADH:ubiquinone oxidoreductase subunit C [Tindallia magadiensis]|uniref:Ion-translocating oxidoreductase complex subunit G n=1 Tax=Tindallia magadiensis TaxID=69895 RepID=A0A1I3AY74_9FIRM|nr:FMN-binding protein [Tindallia magadiensis]SFH54321.1 Na+-transporting NADH:ubiquinone oxidoreductase subunit C [Tindallia magadiensis]